MQNLNKKRAGLQNPRHALRTKQEENLKKSRFRSATHARETLNYLMLEGSTWTFRFFFTDWNLSSTELEPGKAIGAFLQTPAPVLDKISGPMGAPFLSSTGLGSGNLIGWAQFPPAPALDKNRSPIFGCVDKKKELSRQISRELNAWSRSKTKED